MFSILLMLSLAVHADPSDTVQPSREVHSEASEEIRRAAAEQRLAETPDVAVVYVRGLCCLSCAIGIRTKVKKLDFVDRQRLEQGVELDVRTQLVTVAIQPNEPIDPSALAVAIERAGYEPERLYQLQEGVFVEEPLVLE